MQYNIKIKANDGEFSLNSQDKDIIAREMDLYFSYFFGASKEFESKIKKVEINNSNVKSIEEVEEIEEVEKAEPIEEASQTPTIIEEPVETPTVAKNEINIVSEVEEVKKAEEKPTEIAKEEIKFQDIKEETVTNLDDVLVFKDENKEIQEEKPKYESIPTEEINIEDLMLSDEIVEIPTEAQETIIKEENDPNQDELENIFNTQVSTPTEIFEEKNEPSILDNFKYPEPTILTQEKTYNIPEYELEKEVKAKENIINLEEKIINEKPQEPKVDSNSHDFKDFIKNFDSEKTIDDFLICSYYIKNIADIESFTMKSINAKLFRATGRIAGMSILNELLQKEFLKVVNDSDIKQYCITEKGEQYFLGELQK